ncbi:c-type cytochrome [Histidinibacterium aquaticum]|uniref:Cytochrome c n=1 Tax=Histidinibacterium aquaticum TaxID=2613962 RepID=A0A5J5GNG8_9RHOB|nr:cytochrome c [Histidinibacterium aquaticum]KAA9009273.1 cytochrome c [Histidinibacterium aquaticum]
MSRIVFAAAFTAAGLAAWGARAEPTLERGRYLVEGPAGCGNCHTPLGPEGPLMDQALAGRLVEETPAFTAIADNITPGGAVADWSDAELARAIREGIRPDGSVIGPPMPIVLYRGLSDDDVMSMVMYLRTVPAVENDAGDSTYNMPLPPAYGPPIETVAHPQEGPTAEYGEYLAGPVAHCMECHTTFGEMGPMFDTHWGAGGYEFHGPWGVSVASNLTTHPEDGLADWSDEDLAQMITQGVRPDGTPMMPPMPYGHFANMTDEDVQAVVAYLRTLPPLPDPEG